MHYPLSEHLVLVPYLKQYSLQNGTDYSSGLKCLWLIWWWQSLLFFSYCQALKVITSPNTFLKIALLITAAFTRRWEKCEAAVMWATWSHLKGGHSSEPPYYRTQWKWLFPARTLYFSITFSSCLTLKIECFPRRETRKLMNTTRSSCDLSSLTTKLFWINPLLFARH